MNIIDMISIKNAEEKKKQSIIIQSTVTYHTEMHHVLPNRKL